MRRSGTRWGVFLVTFAGGVLLAGGGVASWLHGPTRSRPPAATGLPVRSPTPSAPTPRTEGLLNGTSPQVAVAPVSFPMPIVHYQSSVEDATAALWHADGRHAVIQAGTLTLQMPGGQQLISDGTPAADVRVVIDSTRPGPFRVEIGVGHNVFVTVASEATGSVEVDIDAAGVRIGRFVRISTRAAATIVAVDAVLVRVPNVASP